MKMQETKFQIHEGLRLSYLCEVGRIRQVWAKSNKYIFVGYPRENYGYYFYDPIKQKIFVLKHSVFIEKEFFLKGDSGRKIELEKI